jgi:cytochrome c553
MLRSLMISATIARRAGPHPGIDLPANKQLAETGMKFRPTAAALGLALIASSLSVTSLANGNAAAGKVLAYTCHGCHGIPNYKNAYPNYSVPKLGGQHFTYLQNALKAYASGDRPHPTMRSHAATMSDQDRADIAAFLASKPVPAAQVTGTPPPATQVCVACHGADGAKTISDEYPVLAGQYRDYLLQALRDYKSGKRKNPIMAGIITAVDPKDFAAIAKFYSQQKGLCGTDQVQKQGSCGQP